MVFSLAEKAFPDKVRPRLFDGKEILSGRRERGFEGGEFRVVSKMKSFALLKAKGGMRGEGRAKSG